MDFKISEVMEYVIIKVNKVIQSKDKTSIYKSTMETTLTSKLNGIRKLIKISKDF